MGRREQIRGRLKAVERGEPLRWHVQETEDSRREWRGEIADSDSIFALVTKPDDNPVAALIAHAPSDLRDLLAVADAAADMASYVPDSLPKGAGPRCGACRSSVEFCDEQRAAVGRRCRGGDVRDALDRLDNGGDR